MVSFVLVPGAMHGKWTWDRLKPLLEAAGHQVIAEDLPGMGEDRSIALDEITLDHWGEAVSAQVRRAEAPVILAGHSRGGLVIGEAAERVAELLSGLIYITALIAPPGKSVIDLPESGANRPPSGETRKPMRLDAATATAMFYHRCTPEDAAWAAGQLCIEPGRPLETPASVTWARWGKLPRAFIECSDDRTLTMSRQKALQALAPCDPVVTLDSDHSPFLCQPRVLADAMITIATQFAGRA